MKSYEYILKVNREDIDFINKIIEAYEGLAIVRTLDKKDGLISIITTFKEETKMLIDKFILENLDISIIESKDWEGNM